MQIISHRPQFPPQDKPSVPAQRNNHLLRQHFSPVIISVLLAAILPGCRIMSPQTEIGQYRAQMTNGVEQAFASVDGSGRSNSSGGHKEYFVAPDGKLSNNGSVTSPWNLVTA